jgi:hypothetical protein
MFLGSRVRPVRKADNLTAICEPIVKILNISQPYRPPRHESQAGKETTRNMHTRETKRRTSMTK